MFNAWSVTGRSATQSPEVRDGTLSSRAPSLNGETLAHISSESSRLSRMKKIGPLG